MKEHENTTIAALLKQHLEKGDTLEEAARTVRADTPNLSAVSLAQALVAVCFPSAELSKGGPRSGKALLSSASDPLAGPIQIAGALKAAGFSLNDIAAILN